LCWRWSYTRVRTAWFIAIRRTQGEITESGKIVDRLKKKILEVGDQSRAQTDPRLIEKSRVKTCSAPNLAK